PAGWPRAEEVPRSRPESTVWGSRSTAPKDATPTGERLPPMPYVLVARPMRAPSEHPRWRAAGGAAVLAAAAALAACGSSAHNTTPAGAAGTASQGSAATQLQQRFISVVKSVSPEVVQIQTESGLGSGIVYDGKGD